MDIKEALTIKQRMEAIKRWFSDEYSWRVEKYRRLIDVARKDDDGSDPSQKLADLYIAAEDKRDEYNRLEHQLSGNGHSTHS